MCLGQRASERIGSIGGELYLRLVRPSRGRYPAASAYSSVVRGFAPPTDGYDASDLWRGPFSQGGSIGGIGGIGGVGVVRGVGVIRGIRVIGEDQSNQSNQSYLNDRAGTVSWFSPTLKGSLSSHVCLPIGRSGLCPSDRRLRCVGPLARSFFAREGEIRG